MEAFWIVSQRHDAIPIAAADLRVSPRLKGLKTIAFDNESTCFTLFDSATDDKGK